MKKRKGYKRCPCGLRLRDDGTCPAECEKFARAGQVLRAEVGAANRARRIERRAGVIGLTPAAVDAGVRRAERDLGVRIVALGPRPRAQRKGR